MNIATLCKNVTKIGFLLIESCLTGSKPKDLDEWLTNQLLTRYMFFDDVTKNTFKCSVLKMFTLPGDAQRL